MRTLIGCLALVTCSMAAILTSPAFAQEALKVGAAAPEFEMKGSDGKPTQPKTFRASKRSSSLGSHARLQAVAPKNANQ